MNKIDEWVEEDKLILLEGWARNGLTYEQIAHNVGIDTSTLWDWRNKNTTISNAIKKGREVVDLEVERALLKKALGYEYKETIKERINDDFQKKRHNNKVEFTEKQWNICKNYFNNECCYCGNEIELTKDHLQPLKQDGTMTMNNIVPACQKCNSSKKDNQWAEWYLKQEFYNEQKYKKIIEYIMFASNIQNEFENKQDDNLTITKEITKHMSPDTTAQIYWLKSRKPEEWGDKQQIEINEVPTLDINIVDNSNLEKYMYNKE